MNSYLSCSVHSIDCACLLDMTDSSLLRSDRVLCLEEVFATLQVVFQEDIWFLMVTKTISIGSEREQFRINLIMNVVTIIQEIRVYMVPSLCVFISLIPHQESCCRVNVKTD